VKRSPAALFRCEDWIALAAIAAAVLIAPADAGAQAPKSRPPTQSNAQASNSVQAPNNALQGFTANRGKPIKIAASQLEVRDKEKMATFAGDVQVVQGDTNLRTKVLVVYYDDDGANKGAPAAQPGAGGGQQIRRMEARGNVIVTQKDQTATGDNADYDMRSDTVTLTGNVVVTQGQNVLRGQKLVVNTTTGVSRMEMPSGGRVEGLFQSSNPNGGGPGASPRPARTN
jgi:lipopolysaccharide export system protein LptA